MRRGLISIVAVLTAAAALFGTACSPDPAYPWMLPDELKARMDRRDETTILCIDSPESELVVRGAIVVPGAELETWAANVSKTTTVVTYCDCRSDTTAAQAALSLKKLGFLNAHVLQGGFKAWRTAGYPVARANPAADRLKDLYDSTPPQAPRTPN